MSGKSSNDVNEDKKNTKNKNKNSKNNKNNNNTKTIDIKDKDDKKSLGATQRLIIDTLVGTFAGFSLAWFITPMDAAVVQNMNGATTIPKSLQNSAKQILTKPHLYIKRPEFFYVFGTYGGTYLAKNYTDSMCLVTNQSAEKTAFYKFWIVFAVNGGLSVFWKDTALARIFANPATKAKGPAPKSTLACWIMRDIIHVTGAAVLPDYFTQRYGLSNKEWRYMQLSFPLLVQLITTPFFLTGLDLYNYREAKISDRFGRVVKSWIPSAGVRMVRMFAPWSIGLLINKDLRDYLIEKQESNM